MDSKNFLLVVCIFLMSPQFGLYGNIILQSEDVNVELNSLAAYTVESIEYKEMSIIDNNGSAQGTVIQENGIWAGSKHGNEYLNEVSLRIDEQICPVIDGSCYLGTKLELTRKTIIGNSYSLISQMTITPEGTFETISMEKIQDNDVFVFYGVLGSRSNYLNNVIAINEAENILFSGEINNDNSEVVVLDDSVTIVQYSEEYGIGVVTNTTIPHEFDFHTFIWDRWNDNKLYYRLNSLEDFSTYQYFSMEQSLKFIKSDNCNWMDIAVTEVPEPYTLLLISIGALAFRFKKK